MLFSPRYLPEYGQEAIAFQSTAFANDVADCFAALAEELSGGSYQEDKSFKHDPDVDNMKKLYRIDQEKLLGTSKSMQRLTKVVKEQTGLTVEISTDPWAGCHMIPPILHANHVFYHNDFRSTISGARFSPEYGYFKKIQLIQAYDGENRVDLKNNKVTGVFTQISTKINMDFQELSMGNATAREVAAVFLHELGHAFSFFEFLSFQTRTNFILQELVQAYENPSKADEKVMILKVIQDQYGDKKTDITGVENLPTQTAVMVMFTSMTKKLESQTDSVYDETTCEAQADRYVSRLGLGRELMVFLDKLYRGAGMRPTWGNNTMVMISNALWFIITSMAVMVLGGPILIAFYSAVVILVFWNSGAANDKDRYDTLRVRYLRVKHDCVERLKQTKLSKAAVEELHFDIKTLDQMASDLQDPYGWFDRFKNFFFSNHRDQKKLRTLQQELEELAANSLFVQSARLTAT